MFSEVLDEFKQYHRMSNGNDFGNAFGQQSNGNGKINEDIIANSGENSIEAFAVAAAVAATVSPPPNRRRYHAILVFFREWRVITIVWYRGILSC